MTVEQPVGSAVLYVSSRVRPEVAEAFNTWCDSVHHFDTMRVEGFLSLRRFELVEGLTADGVAEYPLLTLYQVEKAQDADFTTPSYAHHSATYTPPPPGVVDGIEFERTVYERDDQVAGARTQTVGDSCITLIGTPGPWLDEVRRTASGSPGVVNLYGLTDGESSVLVIDVEHEDDARALFARLAALDDAGRRSVQHFRQVFPPEGVLLRDREFRPATA